MAETASWAYWAYPIAASTFAVLVFALVGPKKKTNATEDKMLDPKQSAEVVTHSMKTAVPTGEPAVQTPLQQLMYGLIYPAVLGTGITMTAVRAAHHHSVVNALLDPSIELGIIAGLFFCASFDSAFYWPPGQKGHYRKSAFGIDSLEVILMFICFHYLRLFEDPRELQKPDLFHAYLMLGIDVLLQFLWRVVVGLDWLYRWWLRLGIATVLFVGCAWGDSHSWVNMVVSAAVALAVVIYVLSDPRYAGAESAST
jgi:hypothetical protein